jgi:hypothetical protein
MWPPAFLALLGAVSFFQSCAALGVRGVQATSDSRPLAKQKLHRQGRSLLQTDDELVNDAFAGADATLSQLSNDVINGDDVVDISGSFSNLKSTTALAAHAPPLAQDAADKPDEVIVLKQEIIDLKSGMASLKSDKQELVNTVQSVLHNNHSEDMQREVDRLKETLTREEATAATERKNAKSSLERSEAETRDLQMALQAEKDRRAEVQKSADFEATNRSEKEAGALIVRMNNMRQDFEQQLQADDRDKVHALADERSQQVRLMEDWSQERLKLEANISQETSALELESNENKELRDRGRAALSEADAMRPELQALRKQVQGMGSKGVDDLKNKVLALTAEKQEMEGTVKMLMHETKGEEISRLKQALLDQHAKDAMDLKTAENMYSQDHESAQENAAEINRLNKALREEQAVHDEALKQQLQQVDTEKAAREKFQAEDQKLQAEEGQEKAKVAKQRAELDLFREQLEKEKSQLDVEKARVAATSATNATPSKKKNITALSNVKTVGIKVQDEAASEGAAERKSRTELEDKVQQLASAAKLSKAEGAKLTEKVRKTLEQSRGERALLKRSLEEETTKANKDKDDDARLMASLKKEVERERAERAKVEGSLWEANDDLDKQKSNSKLALRELEGEKRKNADISDNNTALKKVLEATVDNSHLVASLKSQLDTERAARAKAEGSLSEADHELDQKRSKLIAVNLLLDGEKQKEAQMSAIDAQAKTKPNANADAKVVVAKDNKRASDDTKMLREAAKKVKDEDKKDAELRQHDHELEVETDKMRAQVAALKDQVKTLSADKEQAATSFHNASQESTRVKLAAKLEISKAWHSVHELEMEKNNSQSAQQELEGLRKQAAALEEEKGSMIESLHSVRREEMQLNETLKQTKGEVKPLKEELSLVQNELDQTKGELNFEKMQRADLEMKQKNSIADATKKTTAVDVDAQEQIKKLDRDYAQKLLEVKLSDAQAMDALKTAQAASKASEKSASDENLKLKAFAESEGKRADRERASLDIMREELEQERRELAGQQNANVALSEQDAALKNQTARLTSNMKRLSQQVKEKLAATKEDHEQAISELRELMDQKVNQSEQQIAQLQEKLHQETLLEDKASIDSGVANGELYKVKKLLDDEKLKSVGLMEQNDALKSDIKDVQTKLDTVHDSSKVAEQEKAEAVSKVVAEMEAKEDDWSEEMKHVSENLIREKAFADQEKDELFAARQELKEQDTLIVKEKTKSQKLLEADLILKKEANGMLSKMKNLTSDMQSQILSAQQEKKRVEDAKKDALNDLRVQTKKDVDKLAAENKQLQSDLAANERQLSASKQENAKLHVGAGAIAKKGDGKPEKSLFLENRTKHLQLLNQKLVVTLKKVMEASRRVNSSLLAEIARDRQALRQEHHSSDYEHEQVLQLTDKLKQLEQAKAQSHVGFKKYKSQMDSLAQDTQRRFEANLSEAKLEIEHDQSVMNESDVIRTKFSILEVKAANLERDNERMLAALRDVSKENVDLKTKLEKEKTSEADVTSQLAPALAQEHEKSAELLALHVKEAGIEEHEKNMEQELQGVQERLNMKVQEQADTLAKRVDPLKAELLKATGELEGERSSLVQEKLQEAKLEASTREAEGKAKAMEQEKAGVLEDLRRSEAANVDHDKASAQERDALAANLSDAQDKLEQEKSDNKLLAERGQELLNETEAMRPELEKFRKQQAAMDSQKVAGLKYHMSLLTAQKTKMAQTIETLMQNKSQQEEVERLRLTLFERSEAETEAAKEKAELEKRLKQEEKNTEAERSKRDANQKALSSQTQKLNKATSDLDRVKAELNQTSDALDLQTATNTHLWRQTRALQTSTKAMIASANSSMADLQERLIESELQDKLHMKSLNKEKMAEEAAANKSAQEEYKLDQTSKQEASLSAEMTNELNKAKLALEQKNAELNNEKTQTAELSERNKNYDRSTKLLLSKVQVIERGVQEKVRQMEEEKEEALRQQAAEVDSLKLNLTHEAKEVEQDQQDIATYKEQGLELLNETEWMRPMVYGLKEKTQAMEADKADMMVTLRGEIRTNENLSSSLSQAENEVTRDKMGLIHERNLSMSLQKAVTELQAQASAEAEDKAHAIAVMRKMHQQHVTLEEHFKEMQNYVVPLKQKLDAETNSTQALQNQVERLRHKANALERDNDNMRKNLRETQQENVHMNETLKHLQQQYLEEPDLSSEAKQLRERVDSLQEENYELNSSLAVNTAELEKRNEEEKQHEEAAALHSQLGHLNIESRRVNLAKYLHGTDAGDEVAQFLIKKTEKENKQKVKEAAAKRATDASSRMQKAAEEEKAADASTVETAAAVATADDTEQPEQPIDEPPTTTVSARDLESAFYKTADAARSAEHDAEKEDGQESQPAEDARAAQEEANSDALEAVAEGVASGREGTVEPSALDAPSVVTGSDDEQQLQQQQQQQQVSDGGARDGETAVATAVEAYSVTVPVACCPDGNTIDKECDLSPCPSGTQCMLAHEETGSPTCQAVPEQTSTAQKNADDAGAAALEKDLNKMSAGMEKMQRGVQNLRAKMSIDDLASSLGIH